jgi:hypothetical protein
VLATALPREHSRNEACATSTLYAFGYRFSLPLGEGQKAGQEESRMATQDILRLNPEELHNRMTQGEKFLPLDVRTEDARRVHPYQLPGTRWLPLAAVVQHANTLPRQRTIVTY